MSYAREDLDRIRETIDFVSLVEQRTELRRAGTNRMTGLCPFHDERTPSFSVNVDDKLFHCFGCGEGGDLFRWVELIEGVDFPGAVELLADRAGIELKTEEEDPQTAERRKRERRLLELLDRTNRFYERQLWETDEARPAREELQRRGLDPKVLKEFRVGYAPSAWDRVLVGSRHAGYSPEEMTAAGIVQHHRDNPQRIYDRFRRRITFPLADRRGRILGFGARALGADQKPKYVNTADGGARGVYHKGQHLFAAHLARKQAARTGEVILCEGYTDVIALHQSGLTNSVGLMGTALTPEQVGALRKLAPSVILALDADRAGREAMLRAAQLAAGSGLNLRVVVLPDGMDPADLLVKRGTDALKQAFAAPIALGRFHVGHVLDQADLVSAEGRDQAIEDLRPVFTQLPPGVLRMELLAEAAGRLRLDPTVLGSLIDHGGAHPASGDRGAGSGRRGSGERNGPAPTGPAARAAAGGASPVPISTPMVSAAGGLQDVARVELAFLAECWAAGKEAAVLLEEDRLTALNMGEAHRIAAALLRQALRESTRPAGPDDSIRRILDLILRQASSIAHPSVDAAELTGIRLELGTVTEAIRSGRSIAAGVSPQELVLRRIALQRRLDEGLGALQKGPRRSA